MCGESVAEVVVGHHYLEMACQGQITALTACEGNYTLPSKEACEYAHSQFMAGDNFLKGFAIDQTNGKLTFPRQTPCGGKTPRHIALDPTEGWLLVANQDSNLIAVFARDPKTGQLQESGPTASIQSPQCLVFV